MMATDERRDETREATKRIFEEIIPKISDEGCRKLLTLGEGIKFGMQAMSQHPDKSA